jgi:2-amino-4-hydroxy-6-hydroxymethyldihydropteridine diphosphokinase
MFHTAYIALGSNLGDRDGNLKQALRRLRGVGSVTRVSSWYETEPMEVTDQPWFLNGAVELHTQREPDSLMRALLEIEREMGRERTRTKGPRSIDLDLLLFDDETVNTPELTLPHPAMHERRFVLAPLAEIAPQVIHPVLRRPALTLLETLPEGGEVRKITRQVE